MQLNQFLPEATGPFIKKAIDPALMTFSEYHNLVNPDHKMHPEQAYDSDLKDLNQYDDGDSYRKVVNTINKNGINFEVRMKATDRWDNQYVKTTPDGDVVRDEKGVALYLSKAEIAAMFPGDKRYRYEHAVFDKDAGLIVGNTQDEWGTLLIRVAREYRRFGFGTLLVKMNRSVYPDRQSGGMTYSGQRNLQRVHSELVRNYLSSGFYSHLVRTGQITTERVKEITGRLTDRQSGPERNLGNTDTRDWLLMSDGQSFVILYDKKLLDIEEPDNDEERHWVDRFILGMASLGSYMTGAPAHVNRLYGSDKIKGFLLGSLLGMEPGDPIRMDEDELKLAQNYLGQGVIKTQHMGDRPGSEPAYYVEERQKEWRYMANREKQYRKHRDPYQEWYARIIDWAESLGEK